MKWRTKIFAAAVVMLAAWLAVSSAWDSVRDRRAARRRAATEAALKQQLPYIQLDEVPLALVLDSFTIQTGLELVVDWPALARHGVTPESRVNTRVRGIRARKYLTILLDTVGKDRRLDHWVDEAGRVRVSEPPGAEIAVWDVFDISHFLQPLPGEVEDIAAARAEEVRSLVVETIATDTWAGANPRGFGQCRVFNKKLVVFQTPENLDQLGILLEQLDQSRRHHELRRLLGRLEGSEVE